MLFHGWLIKLDWVFARFFRLLLEAARKCLIASKSKLSKILSVKCARFVETTELNLR